MAQAIPAELYELMALRTQDYAIFLLGTSGRILSWNAGAQRIKGYTPEEIIGKHFSIFYTPTDIERNWPTHELQQALVNGRFEDEGWRLKKNGDRFWANVVITALRDDNGKLLAFSKMTRDLTERKRHEEELRQSEERFRLLVDGVSDYAIYLLTPEGMVTSWNQGAHRITGYEAKEIIGQHFSRFYDPKDVQEGKPWTELAMAREHGRAEDEGWRVRNDGTQFWARVVVTALHDDSGRLRGFAKVTQDLTQRRHSESMESAAKQVTEFIAVLAHELRNPLAPIRNSAQILKLLKPGDANFQSAYQSATNVIARQSAQLTRMVDDLLDVNRITRGTLDIQSAPVTIAAVVERAVESARPAIEDGNHRLEVDLPQSDIMINGDEVRLAQALTNLLVNAARYSASSSRIDLRVSRVGGPVSMVRIAVIDTGYGIEPELLASIFGMFIQGREAKSHGSSGLGIGLALARSLVELHHGTLTASSAGKGHGSTFTIEVPALAAAETAPQVASEILEAAGRLGHGSPKRILVVDDNHDAAASLAALLKRYSHKVSIANDGVQALDLFESFKPEIVLLDIGMPGMNGLEVARRMREWKREPRPLIVAVTGWGGIDHEFESKEAGIDFHLVKPINELQIAQIIGGTFPYLH